MLFEIKNRFSDSLIFRDETESMKMCVKLAIESGADLRSADLRRAYLSRADLCGANLCGANLCDANLCGAKYGDCVPMENEPYQLSGEYYSVLILDTHIKIGCKLHSHFEWSNFNDEQIQNMDRNSLSWWKINREIILALSLHHQQKIANK